MTFVNLPTLLGKGPMRHARLRTTFEEPLAMLLLAVPIALVNMAMSVTDTVLV